MKHIIIAGTVRSGKTTLALNLKNKGYTHYKMDSIKRGFFEALNISTKNWKVVSKLMIKVINRIIEDSYTDTIANQESIVFDTPYIYTKDIKKIKDKNVIIIFLGYSSITKEEVFNNIRKYDKENYWTNELLDNELLKRCEENIKFSKMLKKECKKNNILYFDTSHNRNKVLEYIEKLLEKGVNL